MNRALRVAASRTWAPAWRAMSLASGSWRLLLARRDCLPEVTLPSSQGAASISARISATWVGVSTPGT